MDEFERACTLALGLPATSAPFFQTGKSAKNPLKLLLRIVQRSNWQASILLNAVTWNVALLSVREHPPLVPHNLQKPQPEGHVRRQLAQQVVAVLVLEERADPKPEALRHVAQHCVAVLVLEEHGKLQRALPGMPIGSTVRCSKRICSTIRC